jgi:hypothetical protein
MGIHTKNFGLSIAQGSRGVIEVQLDATVAVSDAGVAGYTAGDLVKAGPLPAGTLLTGDVLRTDATWTGTIDVGITGATQLLGVLTPSTTVGNTTAATPATVCAANDTATYLVITINSTNATGKARLFVDAMCAIPYTFAAATGAAIV